MRRFRSHALVTVVLFMTSSPPVRAQASYEDLLSRGEQAYLAGDAEAALDAFLAAVEEDPDRWEGYYYAGLVLHEKGEIPQAIEKYREAIERKPDASEPLNNLAVLLLETGEIEQALATSEQAVEADPENFEASYTLGEILAALGRIEEAIAAWKASSALAPGDPDPWLAIAELLLDAGDDPGAAAALAEAFERAPHDVELGLMALELLTAAGEKKRALALARKLAKRLGPKAAKHVEWTFRVARSLRLLGDPSGCVDLLSRLPAGARESFSVQTELGLALLDLGDHAAAAAAFDAALDVKPDHPAALLAKADALCAAGKRCKAKKAYRTFLEKAPVGDPNVPVVEQKLADKKAFKKLCKKKKKKKKD